MSSRASSHEQPANACNFEVRIVTEFTYLGQGRTSTNHIFSTAMYISPVMHEFTTHKETRVRLAL